MRGSSLKNNSISTQCPSARPNIVMLIVLLYWLFVVEILIPHIIPMIETALGIEPIMGLLWQSLAWFLRLGVPIAAYLIYSLLAKKQLKFAFSIARISVKNILYVAVFAVAIRAVDLLAMRFIPFAVGSVSTQIGGSIWQALIVGVLFAVVYEEFMFRGFLYSEYRNQRISIWKIALATGLFFGLIHFGVAVFTAAIFGILWAYVLYCTRSIWAPLLFHTIYNSLGSLLTPGYYASNQAEYESLMLTFLICTAIAAAVSVPAAIVCVKRFLRENRHNVINKTELAKETKAFTVTYWLLIAVMIAVIFLFRL